METFMAIIFTTLAGIFAYGAFHVNEERRKGRRIPLPWEKR